MRKTFSVIACLLMMAIIAGSGSAGLFYNAKAQSGSASDSSTVHSRFGSPMPVTAIVELEGESVVKRERAASSFAGRGRKMDFQSASALAYESEIETEQNDFNSRASLVSPGLRVRDRLRKLANAIVIEATGDEVVAIAALPGVKRVEPVKQYDLTLSSSVSLVGAPVFWERAGGSDVAGEGIKIAIIDTGIDIGNPLFADAGYRAPAGFPRGDAAFANNKVIVAKAFLSDSNATPEDENGHGTNVAGIAAGNLNTISPLGALSGVAPRAYLGNYRVFGRTGSASDDRIARALEEAATDGFDVANLSLGSQASGSLDFLARAVETAVAGGMIVVVAAGNSGSNGEMSVESPGIAPSAITVGATSNSHRVGPTVSVTGPDPVASNLAGLISARGAGGTPSASLDSNIGPFSYTDVGSLDGQSRACNDLPANSLDGKIALIERGDCTFADKVNRAAAAGAKAVIVFNQSVSENPESGGEELVNMSVNGTTIPSVFVARSNGLALREWVKLHQNAQASIQPIGSGAVPSDVIAGFSSRGPSSLATLKPDLTAPGVSIYSGAITSVNSGGVSDPGGFASVNGTSQATPHVAGAAALVKQLHPTWTPAQVKSVLMSSADGAVFADTDKQNLAGVLNAGAGRVNLARAIDVSATSSPASLSFGINKRKKKAKKNTYSMALSLTSALDGQNAFDVRIEQLDPGAGFTVTSSAQSVMLARNQSASITITVRADKTTEKRDYTGYVAISDPGGQTMRVPFWVRYF